MANVYQNSMEISINGLQEIEKRLQALPEKLRKRRLRSALEDGTEILRAEAARLAPKLKPQTSEWVFFMRASKRLYHLKDCIISGFSITPRNASAKVGIDYSKVRWGHVVEFGSKPHKVGKFQHPGAKKQPFMRPAIDNKGEESINVMVEQLTEAVEEEV